MLRVVGRDALDRLVHGLLLLLEEWEWQTGQICGSGKAPSCNSLHTALSVVVVFCHGCTLCYLFICRSQPRRILVTKIMTDFPSAGPNQATEVLPAGRDSGYTTDRGRPRGYRNNTSD